MTSVPKEPEREDDSNAQKRLQKRAFEKLAGPSVSMAMRDSGAGSSSLRHLRRLSLSRTKVDRCFIVDLPHPNAAAIVRGIVSLAHSLRLQIIAEGVATQAQAAFLAANGCPAAQGTPGLGAGSARDADTDAGGGPRRAAAAAVTSAARYAGRPPACEAVTRCGRIGT